jgi:hypothetical protein
MLTAPFVLCFTTKSNYFNLKKKNKFEGCPLQPSQKELADKTKSWPDQKKLQKKIKKKKKKLLEKQIYLNIAAHVSM